MGTNDTDQISIQKGPIQQQIQIEQQEEIQEDVMREAPLQQQEQVQQQESMIEILHRQTEQFWAQHAAPAGAVAVEQRPQEANMSRKQRKKLARQREKALKEGRKYSNYADEYTAQIHRDYVAYTTERSARNKALSLAMQAHPQEAAVDMLHKRVTSAFLPDYKLNKKGQPASKQDRQIAHAAQKQAEDYLYGSQEQKNAVLDGIVQQVCAMRFTTDMFTPQYIRAHFSEMKRLDEKLIIMTNIRNLHPEYFQAMPQDALAVWNATQSLSNVLSSWIGNTGEISGLDTAGAGMAYEPTTEAEFMVVRQAQDEDIRAAMQQWSTAIHSYQTSHGGEEA